VIPALDENCFSGTFYIPGKAKTLKPRLEDWRVASEKHELGNHTITHPCDGSLPGREWVNPNFDLSKYSVEQMVNEVKVANILLQAIDGKTERTFAYTCGDMEAGGANFVELIKPELVAARSVERKYNYKDSIDLFNVYCFSMNGHSAAEMIAIVEKGMAENALTVFLFHGVGGEHSMNVSEEDHLQLVNFLKHNEANIWVDNMVEVAKYIQTDKN
jgi:sialate O-acetylesterase